MKTNYTNNKFLNGLKALAFLCVFGYTTMNAQTETVTVEIFSGAPDATLIDNGINNTLTMTGTATVTGVGTFDVSFVVTPATGYTVFYSSAGWGVSTTSADTVTFRASTQGSCTIGGITYSNFTGGLSSSNITDENFIKALVASGNHAQDRFTYVVSGTEYISLAQFSTSPEEVDLYTHLVASTTPTSTALTALKSFGIQARSTTSSTKDRWGILSIKVEVVVDYAVLGITDFNNNSDNQLTISPNPVNDVISLNVSVESAQIIDLTGRTVANFAQGSNEANVSALLSGSYILKAITTEGKVITKQFIKK
jgi:hypothetical protein